MPIGIDINKAKQIHKDKIRLVRNPLLEKEDVNYMKALESGDGEKVAEVVVTKQALRNVPNIVDEVEISGSSVLEVTTELKQVWNEELLGLNPLIKR